MFLLLLFLFCLFFLVSDSLQLFRSENIRCESSRYSFVIHKKKVVLYFIRQNNWNDLCFGIGKHISVKSIFLRVLFFFCFMLVGKHGKIILFYEAEKKKYFPRNKEYKFFIFEFFFQIHFLSCFSFLYLCVCG